MKDRETKRKAGQPTWWLSGEEFCVFCSQRHAYHTQYICIACDRPLCPHCAMISEELEALCPHCAEELEK